LLRNYKFLILIRFGPTGLQLCPPALVRPLESLDPTAPHRATLHSEQFYRQLAALVADFVYEESVRQDGGHSTVFLGLEVTAVTGYTSDAIYRMGGWKALVLEADQHLLVRREADLNAGRVARTELRLRTRDGAIRHLRDDARPVREPGSGTILTIIGAIRDITSERESQAAIDRYRTHLEALFNNSQTSFVLLDPSGIILTANRMAQETALATLGRELPVGQAILPCLDESHRTEFAANFERALRDHHLISEARHDTPHGPVWLQYNFTPVHNDAGNVAGVSWSAIDISARKQFEEELIGSKEEAEEMSRLKSAFLANMSHEIRTPLTTILGYAALLAEEAPEDLREFTDIIERGGHRLLETLNSVLDLSMLEASTVRTRPAAIDLVPEVQEKVAIFHGLAEEKAVEIAFECLTPSLVAEVDMACFDRILNNLLGNAVKFTQVGRITVTLHAAAGEFHVAITDTGVGISPEFLPHVFEEFKQESTGSNRAFEGTGLGLAITRRLVHLLGGTVKVVSEKGSGSTFTVSLPLVQPAPVVPHRMARAPENRFTPPLWPVPMRRPRLLVLEDSPDTAQLLERLLSEHFIPTLVTTPEEACAAVRAESFDAFLLDINLTSPQSGIDVLKQLRTIPETGPGPMFAVTAFALPGDRERFLAAGFHGYISKPFSRKALINNIFRAIPGPSSVA